MQPGCVNPNFKLIFFLSKVISLFEFPTVANQLFLLGKNGGGMARGGGPGAGGPKKEMLLYQILSFA